MNYLKRLLLIFTLVAINQAANSATYNVINYDGANSSVFIDTNNNQVGSGFVGVGYFTISDANIQISNASSLATAFQRLGNTGSTSYDLNNGYFMNGAFEHAATGSIDAGSNFIGQFAYVVVGNATTLAASTEAFIYKTTFQFAQDPTSPVSLNFIATTPAGTTLLGETGITYTPYFSGAGSVAGNQVTTAFRLEAIPEPSTTLLAAFGIIALLRRRR